MVSLSAKNKKALKINKKWCSSSSDWCNYTRRNNCKRGEWKKKNKLGRVSRKWCKTSKKWCKISKRWCKVNAHVGGKKRRIYKTKKRRKSQYKLSRKGSYPMSRGHLFYLNKNSNGRRITAKLIKRYPKAFSVELHNKHLNN